LEDEDEGDDTIWKTPTTSTHVYTLIDFWL